MCLENTKGIKTAEEDITVWKVLRIDYWHNNKLCTVFKNRKGLSMWKSLAIIDRDFTLMIKSPAIGFDTGYGFHSFLAKDDVEEYHNRYFLYENGLRVVELIIPKETRYEEGSIRKNLFGGGLNAVRSEYLRFPYDTD